MVTLVQPCATATRWGRCLRAARLGGLVFLVAVSWREGFPGRAQPANTPRASEIARQLDALNATISTEVTAQLRRTNFTGSYTTVWRQFEDAAIRSLCTVLPRHIAGLSERNFDAGKTGREKNRTADLAITCGEEQIEISIKAARRSANPENDLGTFRDHPGRKQAFVAAFTLWVRYDDGGSEIICDRVFFDRTWRFVGKSTLVDGVKYRKKDGNLRPKPWAMFDSGECFWNSEEEFEAALQRSELFRANELIKEHLEGLTESDQRLLYERLRQKFEDGQPRRN